MLAQPGLTTAAPGRIRRSGSVFDFASVRVISFYCRWFWSERKHPGLIGFMGKREGDTVYDEAPAIDRRLEQNDHKDRVRLLGFQQDEALVLLYQAAAALLLPSVVEGFGLSAVEAAKCGTHAVVTRMNDDPRVDRQSAA